MRDQRFSPTTVVGAIAAAATTGALIAIGHRVGHAGASFAAIANVVRRGASGSASGLVIGGVLIQTAWVFVWSAVCVRIAERTRSRTIAALLVAAVNFLVSGFVARWTGYGMASELTLGDRMIYAMVLTASLIVGMRYAFLHPRETATS